MTYKVYGAESTSKFRRGDIVTATTGGRFIVWTVGDDILAVAITRTGSINPWEPLHKLQFNQAVRYGRATDQQIDTAKWVVSALPAKCIELVKERERYEPDWHDVFPDGPAPSNRHFWDGDQFADNCGWKR